MSIAVMNWVWANSPTAGNERLVLLALADACSRDDGTGCWPSAATIARQANVSARTVRRVIARLEAGGHVVVHRGGGRSRAGQRPAWLRPGRTSSGPGQCADLTLTTCRSASLRSAKLRDRDEGRVTLASRLR